MASDGQPCRKKKVEAEWKCENLITRLAFTGSLTGLEKSIETDQKTRPNTGNEASVTSMFLHRRQTRKRGMPKGRATKISDRSAGVRISTMSP